MDLDQVHKNVQNTQKWIKLYDIMLGKFKVESRCVTMYSAYMGNITVQIGRHEWKMNMVGTTAENYTEVDVKEDKKGMKKGMYDSIMYQHNDEELMLAMWSDNNIV